ncbi:MAG: hypothetical protein WCX31_21490 [Salinivirgaceae bacterium]
MRKVLIAIIVITTFQMCSLKKNDGLKVELNPEIEIGLNKYKSQLGIENIDINYEDSSMHGDSVNSVHVLLFNPKRMTLDEAENESLTLEIAGLVYQNIINKNAFSKIDIDFIYEKTFLRDYDYISRHTFTCEQIENYCSKLE